MRCMANNYSALGFWRSWHRSYNLWLIRHASFSFNLKIKLLTSNTCRYIYIPLGGTKNLVLSTVLIFTFVALWHDLSFRLLAWGWLVSLFIIPELAAVYWLPASKVHFLTYLPHGQQATDYKHGSMEVSRGIDTYARPVRC